LINLRVCVNTTLKPMCMQGWMTRCTAVAKTSQAVCCSNQILSWTHVKSAPKSFCCEKLS